MRPINARTFMIAAVSAAVLAGTVVPANAAELTDPAAPTEVAVTDGASAAETGEEEAPAADAAETGDPAADENGADDSAFASWKQDDIGWWFDFGDGTYAKDEVIEIDDATYRFDARGYMITGWHNQEGMWEYFAPSGAQAVGWNVIDGSWYYLDPETGWMRTGWLELDGTWYYMNASGDMAMGWIKYNDEWYYLGGSGAMVTGWAKIGDTWYYMNETGVMLIGWVKVGDTWYYMNASGAMATGTQWIEGERHWFYDNGAWWGAWN